MLTLIGLGISDEYDMTLRGIEEAKKSDKIYFESYTGKWLGSLENLQKILGKDQIFILKRFDLEENSKKILDEAKEKNISILVQGDPMIATTHSSILLEAKKIGIETKIIHNSSIFSAISETGLHIYKFGPTVTIPFLEKTGGKLPKSVYETMKENKNRGLHTLCLLDVSSDARSFMAPLQGIDLILGMERQFGKGVIEPSQKVVVLCKSGEESKIFYNEIEAFHKNTIMETPAVVIVPGKLHFAEKEFLENFKS